MGRLRWLQSPCAIGALHAAVSVALPAQTLTTLVTLSKTDGYYPSASLIQAPDGSFYGTSSSGGPDIAGGTVFRITP
jgi:hypothetical protein